MAELASNEVALDTVDRRLLDAVQVEVPLTARPFAALGRQVEIGEADCIDRLRRLWQEAGLIRQISAIFDTRSLGYDSSLVGACVPTGQLEAAAAVISDHPGVSHNYERAHRLNLWFTLAVPPDSTLGLEGTIERLRTRTGASSMLLLPTLKLYKIGVRFSLSAGDGEQAQGNADGASARPARYGEAEAAEARSHGVRDEQRPVIRVLQQDLPLVERPFDGWAKEAGRSVDALLAEAATLRERRQMRRFSAVLRHRRAGLRANVMVVWQAPPDRIDAVGERLAAFDQVSHCYQRPTWPDWPYNLYTMVHARSPETVPDLLEAMSRAAGVPVGEMLWSRREFKKQRVPYFTGRIKAWEAKHRA